MSAMLLSKALHPAQDPLQMSLSFISASMASPSNLKGVPTTERSATTPGRRGPACPSPSRRKPPPELLWLDDVLLVRSLRCSC